MIEMAASPEPDPRRRLRCDPRLACKLVCLTPFIGLLVLWIALRPVYDENYKRPVFELKSMNPSPPTYVLPSGNKMVSAGWEACFSSRNPNPKPISYRKVNANLWARKGQICPSGEFHVAHFEQPPGGAETAVCASFTEDSLTRVVNGTVRFHAIEFHANVTYKKNPVSFVRVFCEDVRVNIVVAAGDGNESAVVVTEIDDGAGKCLSMHSSVDIFVVYFCWGIDVIVSLGFLFLYVWCAFISTSS